jgi:glycosyltransferase involved in cell wall biosynthesis
MGTKSTLIPPFTSVMTLPTVRHLAKFYPPAPGGMETHVRTLAQAQAALGLRVEVICVNHAGADGRDRTWSPFIQTGAVEEEDGPVHVRRLGRWASLLRFELCPRLLSLRWDCGSDQDQVLHLHTPNPTMLLALAALRPAGRWVITHHSDIVRQKILRYAVSPFERYVYARATHILASSPTYQDRSALLQRYADKVVVAPFGLDLTPYLHPGPAALEFAARLRAEHPGPLWLAVGRLVYYKGLEVALQALAIVPGTLLVVGAGPLAAVLRRQAEQLGVANRVVWAGRFGSDELTGAYQAATALWFPSNARSEAFGLVQVEAMASGCPVINTALPGSGVPWVSPHEQTGLTVPVNDPAAFAAAAQRLLAEPGLRERLAANARTRACQEFDHHLMAERSIEIYRQALGYGKPSSGNHVPSPGG